MHRVNLRVAATLGVAALLTAGTSQAVASGHQKRHKVSIHCTGKLTGTSSSQGNCSSSLGRNKYAITITPPTYTETFTFPKGKLYLTGSVKLIGGKAGGSWKIVKATGKYKGAKGTGSYVVGTNAQQDATTSLQGTITY